VANVYHKMALCCEQSDLVFLTGAYTCNTQYWNR